MSLTVESSPLYEKFINLVRWCDQTWENAIQASQAWFAEKLECSRRHVKRMYAAARRDGFIETLRRWHRTSIIRVFGGRHSDQMSLDFLAPATPLESAPTPACPHSVPRVVSSTSLSREVFRKASTAVGAAVKTVQDALLNKKREDRPEKTAEKLKDYGQRLGWKETPPVERDPWELRLERAEKERQAAAKLDPETRSKLGLASIGNVASKFGIGLA